jgi:hypothetical protein
VASADIEKAVRARLTTAVSGVAGSPKVWFNQSPEDLDLASTPVIVYYRRPRRQKGLTLSDEGGLPLDTFQVDGYSRRATADQDVKDLDEAVRNKFGALAANVGTWSFTGGSVRVQMSRVEDNADDLIYPAMGQELGVDIFSMVVLVGWEQSIPTG